MIIKKVSDRKNTFVLFRMGGMIYKMQGEHMCNFTEFSKKSQKKHTKTEKYV